MIGFVGCEKSRLIRSKLKEWYHCENEDILIDSKFGSQGTTYFINFREEKFSVSFFYISESVALSALKKEISQKLLEKNKQEKG